MAEEKKKHDKGFNNFVQQKVDECVKEANEVNNDRDWDDVISQLGRNGTDLALNATDPLGDGDQRQLTNSRQATFHRTLFVGGGHLEYMMESGILPEFPQMCILGFASECERMLNNCATEEAKKTLLETRHGIWRHTPLMITVIGKAIGPPLHTHKEGASEGHVAVAKVLLTHGARCDARDLFGKTILHYAIGPLYTVPGRGADILQIAELCLEHAKRINICNPSLVDYRDRFGAVALSTAIPLNIELLVRILCVKYHANATDVDNFSSHPSIRRIMEKARTGVLLESTCRVCMNDLTTPKKCSACKVPHYCSADCQKKDWKQHKLVCRFRSDAGFTIVPPAAAILEELSKKKHVDYAVGKIIKHWDGSVPKPSLLFPEMGQQFDVLVRINENNTLTIHTEDKSDFYTNVDHPQCNNYDALKQLVIDFAGQNVDKKVYLRAIMNEEGKVFISSLQHFYRRWVG